MKYLFAVSLLILMNGCAISNVSTKTPSETISGYSYIPIDPIAVKTVRGEGCTAEDSNYEELLNSLPDNSVRTSIEENSVVGKYTYATAKVGHKNESFRITSDYINADTFNLSIGIAKFMRSANDGEFKPVPLAETPDARLFNSGSEVFKVTRSNVLTDNVPYIPYNIPIYIGIGLRVTADISIVGGNANISGLGILGVEADANKVMGSLTVQTLGVNGKSVSAALPFQTELNRTTAQNAIVAASQIKTLLYAKDDTIVKPRVVGFYLPFPANKALINAIISEISKSEINWPRPCKGSRD